MTTTPKMLGTLGDRLDLEMKQGKTFGPHTGTIKNPDGTPMDLTGCTLRASMRRNPNDATVFNFDVAVTDAAEGEFTLGMSKTATATISPPKYEWDLELQDSLGRELPVCYGEVIVALEVTHV